MAGKGLKFGHHLTIFITSGLVAGTNFHLYLLSLPLNKIINKTSVKNKTADDNKSNVTCVFIYFASSNKKLVGSHSPGKWESRGEQKLSLSMTNQMVLSPYHLGNHA